ncbi:MAG: nucleoside hydrolase [Dehalococcoidia bacterium]
MAASNQLRLVIDTDTGTDDAVALLMALRRPDVLVEAITTVAGNVEVEHCLRNVHYVLELCGQDLPVYRGADRPLVRRLNTAAHVHGSDGLGDIGLRPRMVQVEPETAAAALVDLIRSNPGELTLVTLAPLTNIALALALAPEICGLVRRVVMMGGAANTMGNATPAAEFNIWCDPEAARLVFRSGMPITMIGIELCRGEYAHSPADQEALAALGSPFADFVVSMCHAGAQRSKRQGQEGHAGLPDAVAMAVALDPSILTEAGTYSVDVETRGELTAGETVVDRLHVLEQPATVQVGHAIAADRYKAMVRDACRSVS